MVANPPPPLLSRNPADGGRRHRTSWRSITRTRRAALMPAIDPVNVPERLAVAAVDEDQPVMAGPFGLGVKLQFADPGQIAANSTGPTSGESVHPYGSLGLGR